ncbi:MAG: NUDIX hydrolase [Anaerolineae bacterium]|nr:NUDIX hydrolase [Anaerolineae bacterium]
MNFKRMLANLLQEVILLRWAFSIAVRLFAPRNNVGVMGAIFNSSGQVLLVEHVFRPQQPWGLPGGWVERGEDPAQTIRRELQEELNLAIDVRKLLFCEPQGGEALSSTPLSLAIVYYCRLIDEQSTLSIDNAHSAYEILSYKWVYPHHIEKDLPPQQRNAIRIGQTEFDKEKKVQITKP